MCNGYNFDEKSGSRVQAIVSKLAEQRREKLGSRLASVRRQFSILERSKSRSNDNAIEIHAHVRNLVDMGRLFDKGDVESQDMANICFDAATAATKSDADREFVEHARGRFKVEFAKIKSE